MKLLLIAILCYSTISLADNRNNTTLNNDIQPIDCVNRYLANIGKKKRKGNFNQEIRHEITNLFIKLSNTQNQLKALDSKLGTPEYTCRNRYKNYIACINVMNCLSKVKQ